MLPVGFPSGSIAPNRAGFGGCVAEKTDGQDTATETSRADTTDADRWLIVGFVVSIVVGLGALGWLYHSTDQAAPLCSNADAGCRDKTDLGAQ